MKKIILPKIVFKDFAAFLLHVRQSLKRMNQIQIINGRFADKQQTFKKRFLAFEIFLIIFRFSVLSQAQILRLAEVGRFIYPHFFSFKFTYLCYFIAAE